MSEQEYYYLQEGEALQIGDEYEKDSSWKVLTEEDYNQWRTAVSHYWPDKYPGMGRFRRRLNDQPNEGRVISSLDDRIGGDEAYSYLPEGYTGPCKMNYQGNFKQYYAVFPSPDIAYAAAAFALRPDLGGYSNINIEIASDSERVTHDTAEDWMFE